MFSEGNLADSTNLRMYWSSFSSLKNLSYKNIFTYEQGYKDINYSVIKINRDKISIEKDINNYDSGTSWVLMAIKKVWSWSVGTDVSHM